MSVTAGDGYKFGTYYRHAATGLDYADQRWYSSQTGRFLTPDPYIASGGPGEPGSWNRYGYVEGDPVNRVDPTGLFYAIGSAQQFSQCVWVTDLWGWSPLSASFSGCVTGGSGAAYGQFSFATAVGAGGGPPHNKGGLQTNPTKAAETAWQYLESEWKECLEFFGGDTRRFSATRFKDLLIGEKPISWYDTRDSRVASRTIGSITGTNDATTLSRFVGASNAVVIELNGVFLPHVVIGPNYFTDVTQTEQIAVAVHEALHVQMQMDDETLKAWLGNFGFKATEKHSGDITTWIAKGCSNK